MTTKFAGVRQLFAGRAAAQAREDDDDNETGAGATANGPTEAQVNALVAEESAKAAKAERERWSKVMSTDEAAANPKHAAHLLTAAGGAMSADEVIGAMATAGKSAPAADTSTEEPRGQGANAGRNKQLAEDRAALENNADTRKDTGAAGGRPGARNGEGEDEDPDAAADRKKARQERNAKMNENTLRTGARGRGRGGNQD